MKDLQGSPFFETRESRLSLESATTSRGLPRSEFSVYEVRPQKEEDVRGGIVLIQEIFGVNRHIQSLARRYAARGYAVWAPAFFDHVEPGIELGYNDDTFARGRELAAKIGWDQALEDLKVSAKSLRATLPRERARVASVGFCWGGSLAWLAACRLEGEQSFDACVSYYGRQTWDYRDEGARVPVLCHFGRRDPLIPMLNVEAFQKAQPKVPVFVYEAGHGFSCDERRDFNAEAADVAASRTFAFLRANGI